MDENINGMTEETKEQPLGENMKLCKTCGQPIAKNAKRCPACGAKNKKPLLKRFWFWVVVVIAIAALVSLIRDNKTYDLSNPDYTVLSDQMMKDFEENESSAKSKYNYKVVSLTGPVGDVKDDYVRIDCYTEDLMLYTIDVYMKDSADLAKFTKGQVVTVVGVGTDYFLLGSTKLNKAIIADSPVGIDYNSATTVSISSICKAYSDNSVNANAQYLYKTVEITGTVSTVLDDYFVIREKTSASLDDLDELIYVYPENKADLSSVKDGQKVTVVGQCFGSSIICGVKVTRAKLK